MLFQKPLNYIDDEFQIKKMKSYNDAHASVKITDAQKFNSCNTGRFEYSQKVSSVNGNDVDGLSNQVSNKKRSRKAYTKKSKKLEEAPQQREAYDRLQDSTEKSGGDYNTTIDKKSTSCSVRFAPEPE